MCTRIVAYVCHVYVSRRIIYLTMPLKSLPMPAHSPWPAKHPTSFFCLQCPKVLHNVSNISGYNNFDACLEYFLLAAYRYSIANSFFDYFTACAICIYITMKKRAQIPLFMQSLASTQIWHTASQRSKSKIADEKYFPNKQKSVKAALSILSHIVNLTSPIHQKWGK